MSRKIKLIAIDIDETLARPTAKDISPENRSAIKCAQDSGVLVTLATGRIYSTTQRWVERLHIDMPVISCNGADIRKQHKTIYSENMDDQVVQELIQFAHKFDVRKYIFSGDYVCCTPDDQDELLFTKWFGSSRKSKSLLMKPSFEDLFPLVQGNVQKVLLWAQEHQQHQEAMAALQYFHGSCSIVTGESLNVEITKKDVSKARALKYIADMHGIHADEIMAIGDNGNDIAMLQFAGYGVAMANAATAVKQAAKYTTESCDENGVATAINQFLFSGV